MTSVVCKDIQIMRHSGKFLGGETMNAGRSPCTIAELEEEVKVKVADLNLRDFPPGL